MAIGSSFRTIQVALQQFRQQCGWLLFLFGQLYPEDQIHYLLQWSCLVRFVGPLDLTFEGLFRLTASQTLTRVTVELSPEMIELVRDNARFVFTGSVVPSIIIDPLLPIKVNHNNGIIEVSG